MLSTQKSTEPFLNKGQKIENNMAETASIEFSGDMQIATKFIKLIQNTHKSVNVVMKKAETNFSAEITYPPEIKKLIHEIIQSAHKLFTNIRIKNTVG